MQFKIFQITYSTILINPLINYNITALYRAQPYGSAMHVCSAHAYICANAYICEAGGVDTYAKQRGLIHMRSRLG